MNTNIATAIGNKASINTAIAAPVSQNCRRY